MEKKIETEGVIVHLLHSLLEPKPEEIKIHLPLNPKVRHEKHQGHGSKKHSIYGGLERHGLRGSIGQRGPTQFGKIVQTLENEGFKLSRRNQRRLARGTLIINELF